MLPVRDLHIGSIFTFDSTIEKVIKIALEEAVKDVNANAIMMIAIS